MPPDFSFLDAREDSVQRPSLFDLAEWFANTFGPQADMADMARFSDDAMTSFRGGDILKGLADTGLAGASLGFAALPFSVGQITDVIRGGMRAVKPLEDVSRSTVARRLRSAKDELGDLLGIKINRDITTNKVESALRRTLKNADELKQARIQKKMDEITQMKEIIGPDPRFSDTLEDGIIGASREGLPTDIVDAMNRLGLTRSIKRGAEFGGSPRDVVRQLAQAAPDDIKFTDAVLKQKFDKGILDLKFPSDDIFNPHNLLVDEATLRMRPSSVVERMAEILKPFAD